jgi:hypothetical protein
MAIQFSTEHSRANSVSPRTLTQPVTVIQSPPTFSACDDLSACQQNDKGGADEGIVARRNALAALWSGKLQGFAGDDLISYANDPELLNFREPVFDKAIENDLTDTGHSLSSEEIGQALARFYRIALYQSAETD